MTCKPNVATISLEDRQAVKAVTTDWYMHHCLLKDPQASVPVLPKDRTPWSFPSSWECHWAHSNSNGQLSRCEWGAAVAALHFLYMPDLYLWLFPISKSEETITGFPVWERVFSQHGIVHSCWRKVLWRRRKVLFCWLSPISNKHLETFGAAIALANGH